MRAKRVTQRGLEFSESNLKVTKQYYAKYRAVSTILDQVPELVDLIHRDVGKTLKNVNREGRRRGRPYAYTSEHVLRIVICQVVEGDSLRGIVVRIDDSNFLRRFVRIDDSPMMDYTTFCNLKNAICNETWQAINRCLAEHAVQSELIGGDKLRLDTTAVETNIHYPADSTLLWDVYRTLDRLIRQAREIAPEVVGSGRLQASRAKRLQHKITRRAKNKGRSAQQLKPLYMQLVGMVEDLFVWARSVRQGLTAREGFASVLEAATVEAIVEQIDHYIGLGQRVVSQARRRVLEGERVPNDDKLFSIFEPHTELLKRGKAGKDVEFGHMIQIAQVDGKFITDYDVFDKKPVEHQLVTGALESHKKLFGEYPDTLATDKGYYESMAVVERLENKVDIVSIAKKGRRSP